jgi:hypothetical protein
MFPLILNTEVSDVESIPISHMIGSYHTYNVHCVSVYFVSCISGRIKYCGASVCTRLVFSV